jgi:hypothetical protein
MTDGRHVISLVDLCAPTPLKTNKQTHTQIGQTNYKTKELEKKRYEKNIYTYEEKQ